MPIPDFGGLGPDPSFNDMVEKINQLVQKFRNLLLNLDSLNVVSITANSTTITANLDGGAYIRLDGNGMVVNDGTQDVFTVDFEGFVTMTGALVRSAAGYPRVELNSGNNLIGAYKDEEHSLNILNLVGPDVPAIRYWDQALGKVAYIYFDVTDLGLLMLAQSDINIITSGGIVYINNVDVLSTLTSLQTQINGKANSFSGYTGNVTAGTSTMHFTNGILTSVT